MRDVYNQCVEENTPFSETVSTGFMELVSVCQLSWAREFPNYRGCQRDFCFLITSLVSIKAMLRTTLIKNEFVFY